MLFSLMACAVLVVGQLYVTLPLVADIAARFGVSSSIAGWVGTAFGLAYASGFLVLGGLSDRYGRHRVLIGGLMGTAAATALVALAPSLPLLLASRALQGFVAASFPPTALAWVSDALPPPKRPLGISLLSLAFLGAAPMAQMAGAESAPLGLSTLMLTLVPAYVLGALALAVIPGKHDASHVSIPQPPANARMPWGQRSLWSPWAAASTVLFAFVAFHAGMSLANPPGLDLQALRLIGLPPMLATFAAAPLAQRIGPSNTASLGLGLVAVGMLLGMNSAPAVLMLASALLSTGVAMAIPGLIGTVALRSAPAVRARALAIYSFVLFLGASVAAPVAALLTPHGPVAALGVPVLALLAAACLTASRRQPLFNPNPERKA